jgi:DNA-binding MarR family transcriptional regulator
VATQAGDTRGTEWWTFIAAHALLIERVGGDLAAASSLSLGSYNVMRLLHEAPDGRLRLSDLASAVHLTRSGVTRLVNRLEKAGLLRREGDTHDRRGSYAIVTHRGRDQLRRARVVFDRAVTEHFGSCLNDKEAETLNAVLSRMAKTKTGADGR